MSTFRREYRPLSDAQQLAVDEIKTRAEALEHALNHARIVAADMGGGDNAYRAFAIAMAKLEEAVMWAVKGVT